MVKKFVEGPTAGMSWKIEFGAAWLKCWVLKYHNALFFVCCDTCISRLHGKQPGSESQESRHPANSLESQIGLP